MARYRVEIKKSAEKELKRLPSADQERVIENIRGLSSDPRPPGSKKLSGEEKYRLRRGNYRILYEIQDVIVTVVVVRIAHRKNAYLT